MALRQVTVEGFKSIRRCELELRSLNLLVGANGAGKSNFLDLFDLLGELINGNLRTAVAKAGGAERLLHNGSRRTEAIELRLAFGANSYQARLAPAVDGSLYFEDERCSGRGQGYSEPFVVNLGRGHVESKLPEEAADPDHKIASWVLRTMSSWVRFHFHDTSAAAPVRQAGPIGDNRALRRDAGNLAAFLFAMRSSDPAAYRRIVDSVRLVAPFFEDFELSPDRINEHLIRLVWRAADSDAYADATSLSDGTLRFMCLATLLLQPSPPSLILIDEPELGLHPFALVQLAGLMEAASRRHQLIVSTQSTTLLNQFGLEDIVIVERDEGASQFGRLDPERLEEWLAEYSVGELWEKNVLGGRPAGV